MMFSWLDRRRGYLGGEGRKIRREEAGGWVRRVKFIFCSETLESDMYSSLHAILTDTALGHTTTNALQHYKETIKLFENEL